MQRRSKRLGELHRSAGERVHGLRTTHCVESDHHGAELRQGSRHRDRRPRIDVHEVAVTNEPHLGTEHALGNRGGARRFDHLRLDLRDGESAGAQRRGCAGEIRLRRSEPLLELLTRQEFVIERGLRIGNLRGQLQRRGLIAQRQVDHDLQRLRGLRVADEREQLRMQACELARAQVSAGGHMRYADGGRCDARKRACKQRYGRDPCHDLDWSQEQPHDPAFWGSEERKSEKQGSKNTPVYIPASRSLRSLGGVGSPRVHWRRLNFLPPAATVCAARSTGRAPSDLKRKNPGTNRGSLCSARRSLLLGITRREEVGGVDVATQIADE